MMPPEVSQEQSLSFKEYCFLREEIRHQDNLINARLSWLVSSQSFLLSGFAVTLNGSAQSLLPIYAKLNVILVNSLPVAGLVTDAASYLTIWAAILRMKNIRNTAGTLHPPHLPPIQADRLTRRLGLSGPTLIPLVFLTVWLAVIIARWLF